MNIKIQYLYGLIILLMASCKKEKIPDYPIIPSIEIESVEVIDTIDILGNKILILRSNSKYTDGDSNFLDNGYPNDSIFDCIITLYKKTNGVFKIINEIGHNPDSIQVDNYKEITCLFPNSSNTHLVITRKTNNYEGYIELEQKFFYPEYEYLIDTLKYRIQILDKDLNFSNPSEKEFIH